jgi:outer membrane protein, heavy metal efflux system
MIRFTQDADTARAELNTLLGRDPDSPVRVQGEFAVKSTLPSVKDLNDLALQSRPDLIAARAAAERSHKQQALAKRAYAPDFTVSAGYMLMPTGNDMRNNYMVEGTMNLPWLNRHKHDAEIAEATARVTEQDAELVAIRNQAFGQIAEALVQARAAQKTASLYHDEIIPQAEVTLESSIVAYENNKTSLVDLLDSQMVVVDASLAWVQAAGDFDARLADLEMAAGAPIRISNSDSVEVKP